ncbi:uncharacterized protein LAESUDRAFT_736567 [Laetiporus sulphureus 93-53]|uniref:Uncharacterized protein n=1 Tax=Laetiporus sulphureus 93-53 TaxID=1314785 RepID=A0A165EFP0_9APHY|nr:uncharacterized protein LAESUDRAFT_736567 [Laetiporus sulphureus 93-53]KZT06960.1 hypothetical protein LAESUDRAFT_736567 [Laetiporus sulphureus 93-53]
MFRWMKPALGLRQMSLHGVNRILESQPKVAAFDTNGCIIQSSFPKKSNGNAPPIFQQWYSSVIITDQAMHSMALADWKKKIPAIGAALPDIPFHLLVSVAHDDYCRPMPGMWYELEYTFTEDNLQIDKEHSFLVGGAAGHSHDHATMDRKWALNINLPFLTHEIAGFSLRVLPASTSFLLVSTQQPEIVVFISYPPIGSYHSTADILSLWAMSTYEDTLQTREKCVKAAQGMVKDGKSHVIDNTNCTNEMRRHCVELVNKLKVPIRSLEHARHNNLYCTFYLSRSQKTDARLPLYNTHTSFHVAYEEPQFSGSFADIKRVNWVFEGDEEEQRRWSMWLHFDGE